MLIRVLGMTLRYENRAEPGVTPGDVIPGPTVFAFWHRSLLVCAHHFRGLDIAILISRSFDGELIARTVELLGFRAIRGSSTRGGASGLRNMERAFREGHRCAITADGPKGPVFVAKAGTAQLAQLVGAPVGTFYVLPLRAWELRSWDRFLIPRPFSRVLVTWPAHVPAAGVTEDAVQAALDRAVAMARQ
nr:lysophospholipid acyltransferase family protein [Granulicella arctica]